MKVCDLTEWLEKNGSMDSYKFELIQYDRVIEDQVKRGILLKKWDDKKKEYLYKRTQKGEKAYFETRARQLLNLKEKESRQRKRKHET